MTEKWSRWEPIQGLSANYYVESISDAMDRFELLLSNTLSPNAGNEKKSIRIIFENSIDSYKRTDETYKFKLIRDLGTQQGTNFYNWAFFKVANSLYIHLLSEVSCSNSDSESLIHFSIFALDSLVEIIADYEPTVQLVESE